MKTAEVVQKLEQMLEADDGDPNSIIHATCEDARAMIFHLRARRGNPSPGNINSAVRIGAERGHQADTNPLYDEYPAAKHLALMMGNYARQLSNTRPSP